jgi:hypothetical protein
MNDFRKRKIVPLGYEFRKASEAFVQQQFGVMRGDVG